MSKRVKEQYRQNAWCQRVTLVHLGWGIDHTSHFWDHPLGSPVVIVWKVVDQHLFMNIITSNFTARTIRKFWCDRSMRVDHTGRYWHHPSTSLACNSVKSGGPTSVSQHNPQQISWLEPDMTFGVIIRAWERKSSPCFLPKTKGPNLPPHLSETKITSTRLVVPVTSALQVDSCLLEMFVRHRSTHRSGKCIYWQAKHDKFGILNVGLR